MKTFFFHQETGNSSDILSHGGIVAVPTETVYGLAADGFNEKAVADIYEVKGRPETKPINLLVSGMADVEKVCQNIPEEAYRLAEAFWPGPLTMILEKRGIVPDIVTSGGKTVGVRCPDHSLTLSLLKEFGRPLAVPSANPSGGKSPVSAEEVKAYFEGKIGAIIDGGLCSVGIASTILALTDRPIRVLRLGGLLPETIYEKTGIRVMV